MSIDELGWFTINILIPIFLPLFGVLPFKILPLPIENEIRLISLVKDGQWCWTSICIGVSSLYELWDANSRGLMLPDFAGINLFFIIALLIFSVGFASGGAVFKTTIRLDTSSLYEWATHYQTLIASVFITVSISFFSAHLHFSLYLLNVFI